MMSLNALGLRVASLVVSKNKQFLIQTISEQKIL